MAKTQKYFWGAISKSAKAIISLFVLIKNFREAKIYILGDDLISMFADHNVIKLDVAMSDTDRMKILQAHY